MKFNIEQDVRNRYNKVPGEGDDRKPKTLQVNPFPHLFLLP